MTWERDERVHPKIIERTKGTQAWVKLDGKGDLLGIVQEIKI